jgi:putative oxygen-independent coproporphyrinogen III oxidase
MRHEAAVAGGPPLQSIFFGGGTPSLMPPALVGALLGEAERLWGFAPAIEITLEGNPSSVETANFAELASAGINRVSLGLQALDDAALQFLGRLHGAKEGLAALETAQAAFKRVSIDLIYALPGQTLANWMYSLEQATAINIEHVSAYSLTYEKGTLFYKKLMEGGFEAADEKTDNEMFFQAIDVLHAGGIEQYEISNYARPGFECRNNLAYWLGEEFLGIGPAAAYTRSAAGGSLLARAGVHGRVGFARDHDFGRFHNRNRGVASPQAEFIHRVAGDHGGQRLVPQPQPDHREQPLGAHLVDDTAKLIAPAQRDDRRVDHRRAAGGSRSRRPAHGEQPLDL